MGRESHRPSLEFSAYPRGSLIVEYHPALVTHSLVISKGARMCSVRGHWDTQQYSCGKVIIHAVVRLAGDLPALEVTHAPGDKPNQLFGSPARLE